MTRATIAGGAVAIVLVVLLAFAAGQRLLERRPEPAAVAPQPATAPSPAAGPAGEADQGFLYGRVTTDDGGAYEGRLRWGQGQEAFWGDLVHGVKDENPWAAFAPTERRSIGIFGVDIIERERPIELRRPFVVRFGDLVRIENHGAEVRVVLKSGTAIVLNRFDASDFDDGVRVWDRRRGVVDLAPRQIHTIELLPTAALAGVPERLHGTVRTGQGDFTGFVLWNRSDGLGSDELDGRTARGEAGVRFDTLRSIARRSPDSVQVTLRDGRRLVLSESREVGEGNAGLYVDDLRYGRVLVHWDAFERVDFSPAGSGPAYDDFPPGEPLAGSVTTRAGRRLAGRLVYDFDESETTETLDASSPGLSYTLPFGLVGSIVLPAADAPAPRHARVTLHGGEELRLDPTRDLADQNVGVLVFADGQERPELVPWSEIARIDFDRPAAMYPPLGGGPSQEQ